MMGDLRAHPPLSQTVALSFYRPLAKVKNLDEMGALGEGDAWERERDFPMHPLFPFLFSLLLQEVL
jgi:hypothetical protein